MSEYPHLPLFTDAFIADTMHLNAEETGAYLMLLMVAWRSPDCGVPDDDVKLAHYARVSERRWKTCQYIAGEPSANDDCKCGEETIEGSGYYAHHEWLCHRRGEGVDA